VLAIEIRVDELLMAVVALDGEIIRSSHRSRLGDRISVEDHISEVIQLAERIGCRRATIAGRRLVGIGVAVAGLVRDGTGVVATAPNLGWSDLEVGGLLSAGLGLDLPVHVGNDADLGALAEYRFGAGAGTEHMIFVSGEVGVGGAAIVGGVPLRGRLGFAGEVGHIPVVADGRPCRCGSTGCWETVVGERALLEGCGRDPDSGVAGVTTVLGDAAAGDDVVLAAVRRHTEWLAFGLAGLVNLFDPEVIVLGGLFGRLLPLIGTDLDARLAARLFRGVEREIVVRPAALGDDAVVIGAAELALTPLLADPARAAIGA
jgi:predicted NBD/HSP70 family sugar kinase